MGFFGGGGILDILTGGAVSITEWIIENLIEGLGLDDSSVGGKFDKTYVSGYEYYAGLHLGICHGPVDEVREILFRGKTGWKGVAAPGLDPVDEGDYVTREPRDQENPKDEEFGAVQRTDPDLIIINRANLFGGEKVEGGVLGIVEVLHGSRTQGINSYLNGPLRAPDDSGIYTPAYRGVLSMVFHSNIRSVKDYVAKYGDFWRLSIIGSIIARNRMAKFSEPATHHTGFYWGAMTPSIKEVSVRVFRALKGWNTRIEGDGCWYPEKCVVIRDGEKFMNPVHVAVQCLIDLRFGMKASHLQIGQSFVQKANQLHHTDYVNEYGQTVPGEAFGIGLVWSGETSIRSFLNDIMRYINGNVYLDPSTGMLELALVRKVPESEIEDLPMFGPSQIISIGVYTRPTGEETVNTVSIIYRQLKSEKTETVTRSNAAMLSIYNTVISESIEYPGIKNAKLAAEVCEREVKQRTSLGAMYSGIRVSRLAPEEGDITQAAYTLYDGAPFRLYWPEHGALGEVFRVSNINHKSITENYIEFDAVEDYFDSSTSVHITGVADSGWIDTNVLPDQVAPDEIRFIDLPYVTVLGAGGSTMINALPSSTAIFGIMATANDRGVTTGINVYTDVNDSNSLVMSGQLCPVSRLDGALPILDPENPVNSLMLTAKTKEFVGTSEFAVVGAWFIVDNEKILCTAINDDPNDPDYLTMTLERGIYDSIPAAHADNARMWWFNGVSAARFTRATYLAGEYETFYVAATGRIGDAPLGVSTPSITTTLKNTWFAPYPPANVKLDGVLYGDCGMRDYTIEWDCRDKISQSDVPVGWDNGGVPPEPGVSYRVKISTGASLGDAKEVTVSGASGSYKGYNNPSYSLRRFQVWAERAGVASVVFEHTFSRATGYGWAYSYRYGGVSKGVALAPGETPPAVWLTNPVPTPRLTWGVGEWIHSDVVMSSLKAVHPWEVHEGHNFLFMQGAGTGDKVEVVSETTSTDPLLTPEWYGGDWVHGRFNGTDNVYLAREGDKLKVIKAAGFQKDGLNYQNVSFGDDYIIAGTSKINSAFYDGTKMVYCKDLGVGVYSSPTEGDSTGAVTAATYYGTPTGNSLITKGDIAFIHQFGANYLAVYGGSITEQTPAYTSTDLLNWTWVTNNMPHAARSPRNWAWNSYDSRWYVFGHSGPLGNESVFAYSTDDGYTWTRESIGLSAGVPIIGAPISINGGVAVMAGAWLVQKDAGVWKKGRLLFSTAQLSRTMEGKIPFQTSPPGGGGAGTLGWYHGMFRTGTYQYNSQKADWWLGNTSKGALIGWKIGTIANNLVPLTLDLIQPEDHPYAGKYIGCLSDVSPTISDGGFFNSGGSLIDIFGAATNTGGPTERDRYFEVVVGQGLGPFVLGVVGACDLDEVGSTLTSVLLTADGRVNLTTRLTTKDGLVQGDVTRVVSLPELENTVIGFLFAPHASGVSYPPTCKMYINGVLKTTVSNLNKDVVWFPVFTAYGRTLSLNVGQRPFQAAPSGYKPWIQ